MNPFQARPIDVERVAPLAIEPCKQLCDTMIRGLLELLTHFRVRGELSPWAAEGEAFVTTLEAGKALRARLELSPVDGAGTRIRLQVSGSVLILGRKEILQGILERLAEMGGEP